MTNKSIISAFKEGSDLNEREKSILQTIIHLFLLNASPIGSRSLAKYLSKIEKLSSATIRNVMADLEEMDMICHPHTSAGRVPTDKGYRFYVDSLMKIEKLTAAEKKQVQENLTYTTPDNILREASKVLGMLSKYLGIVKIPHLAELIVQKIELIPLNSTQLLIVLALESKMVRTVTVETRFEINSKFIDDVTQALNERISGKSLRFVKDNFNEIVSDFDVEKTPIVRLFIDSADKIFTSQNSSETLHIAGTQNLLRYPEFEQLERVRGVIELIENEDIIIHILDQIDASEGDVKVLIGKELQNELLDDYSLVCSTYRIGSGIGTIGLIGPKRMNYSKVVSLVQYVSDLISEQ